jgi:hypothetical protein
VAERAVGQNHLDVADAGEVLTGAGDEVVVDVDGGDLPGLARRAAEITIPRTAQTQYNAGPLLPPGTPCSLMISCPAAAAPAVSPTSVSPSSAPT